MTPPTITPLLVAELLVEGERWPVYVHVIDHPAARVLVDTGMTELHPELADLNPRLVPLSEQAFDLAGVDVVVNTHLHFDHCGGNHLFAGRPMYVQRQELEDARTEDDYTIREWVEAPGVRYEPVDASSSCCPGSASSRRPGHTRGLQVGRRDGRGSGRRRRRRGRSLRRARRAAHRGPAAGARARARARLARARARALAATHHVRRAAVHMARGGLQSGSSSRTQRSGRRIAGRSGRATTSLRRTRFAPGSVRWRWASVREC